MGRRPEVRWRLTPNDLVHLVGLQTKLLTRAAAQLRRGAALVYSTCSIEPEENQQVVQAVLKELRELKLEEDQMGRPGEPSDGGYWARIRKL
jgi:16S rRNA (cytosine967-C5)-methyltransferase